MRTPAALHPGLRIGPAAAAGHPGGAGRLRGGPLRPATGWMMLKGACHCGAIRVELDTARAPAELPVRVCGCSFCAKHRPRYTSDPSGRLRFIARADARLSRYRFGLRLADFLVCATCGVFVGALEGGPGARGVLNLAVLDRAAELTAEPIEFAAYDSEDVEARRARRARTWTPAVLEIESAP